MPAVAIEERRPGLPGRASRTPRATIAMVAAACCVTVGVVLRWWPRGALWLDEAQSVAFAELPLRSIPGALRQDGAPPAYYLLLHVWMAVFGSGEDSVRSLSALMSTATLVLVFVVARRRWGTVPALMAAGLLAVNPFAIRYGAETRMYALLMLEVVVGLIAIEWAWRRPNLLRLAALAALSGLLLYTHYWAIYLVVVTVAVLALAARRIGEPARRVAIAVAAGFILWIPWLPNFFSQSRHTGTPWAAPASPPAGLQVFWPNLGGPNLVMAAFGLGMLLSFVGGATYDRPWGRGPITSRTLALVGIGTVAVGVGGAMLSSSAVSTRYLAVAVPLVVIVSALGMWRLAPAWRWGVFAAVGVGGLWLAMIDVVHARTPAARIVDEVAANSQPGDVVVYCPDQLAPAVHRLLVQRGVELREVVVPTGSSAARVNWIDYEQRALAVSPSSVAYSVLAPEPPAVWMVVSTAYPPMQAACAGVLDELLVSGRALRLLQADQATSVEHAGLWWFGPPSGHPVDRI